VLHEGVILSEEQVAALEKAKVEKEAHGKIETHHPGFLGAQNTYYAGHIKGVGSIYQQTFIGAAPKLPLPNSTTAKTPLWWQAFSKTGSYPSLNSTACTCCAFLPAGVPNIAVQG
jgi:hypothetical protein